METFQLQPHWRERRENGQAKAIHGMVMKGVFESGNWGFGDRKKKNLKMDNFDHLSHPFSIS